MRKIVKLRLVMTASLTVLALAGCREDQAQGPTGMETAPVAYASAPLPPAEPARVSYYEPERGYAWAERAYDLQRAYYDVPPDYGFDYGPYDPWVWDTSDAGSMYAEPWGDDRYVYYYYEDDAAYPYFVRDDRYGYGFDAAGVLVSLITLSGDYLPVDRYYEAAPLAGRYYSHGRDLRRAALKAPRIEVVRTTWEQRAPRIREANQTWIRAAESDVKWKAWRSNEGKGRQVADLAPHDHGLGRALGHEDRKEWRGHSRGKSEERHAKHEQARAAEDHGRMARFEDRGPENRSQGQGPGPDHAKHDAKAQDKGGGHGRGHGGDGPKGSGGQGHKDHGGPKGGGKKD